MKTEKIFLALAFSTLFLLSACRSGNDTSPLEQALQFASSNRPELEKVLKHYSSSPADSLKYRAAVFLIENMPYYYSYKNEKLTRFQKELYPTAIQYNCSGKEAFQKLEKKYGYLNLDEFEIVPDLHVMTADYLIRNIEQAFKVWQEKPWSKQVSFDDFCEQILPYRIKNEPLSEWREAYYNRFQPVLDSLLKDRNNPVEAIRVLWETIHSQKWVYWDNKPQGYLLPPAIDLLRDNLSGDCYELANRGVYIMRALGIPGGCDFVVNSPYGLGAHAWNYVTDSLKNVWEFSLSENKPRDPQKRQSFKGCAYRQCFGIQQESLPMVTNGKMDLPPMLNSLFIRNVSEYYFQKDSICITLNGKKSKDNILYLCTFNKNEWNPILWTKRQKEKFSFHFVENNLLYLPAYYIAGQIIPWGDPGYVNKDGLFTTICLDTLNKQKLFIKRKYPAAKVWETHYNKRILNGKFQAANNPNFRPVTTLHTITEISDMQWHTADIQDERKYRYIRYLSGDNGRCNMAETVFLSREGQKLQGKVIGYGEIIQKRNTWPRFSF
jgi:hypothetical protein